MSEAIELPAATQVRPQENRALTGIRGVAACWVVLYHYFKDVHGLSVFRPIIARGYIGVDLFFVLSGYVMALNYGHVFRSGFTTRDYLTFLGKRLGRIYPLYIAVTIVVAPLVVAGLIDQREISDVDAVRNVFLVQGWFSAGGSIVHPAWSISVELAAYLAFPVLVALVLEGQRYREMLAVATALAVLLVLSVMSTPALYEIVRGHSFRNGPLDVWSGPYSLLRCFAGFALGMVAFRLSTRVGAALRAQTADAVAVIALAMLFLPSDDVAVVIAFFALTLALTRAGSWVGAFLSSTAIYWLGEISYSIYLVHDPLEGAVRWPAFRILQTHHVPHAFTLANVVPLALTLIVAAGSFYCIEQPARGWAKRLLSDRRT